MTICFIVNQKIKRRKSVISKIESEFKDHSIAIHLTSYPKHAEILARDLIEHGYDYMIAVGGDGTLNEVINGILTAPVPTNKLPVLGVFPKGSANDFARSIDVKSSETQLHEMILHKSYHKIDIGKIMRDNDSQPRYFINIAGLGLGPEVVLHMGNSKLLGPKLSYFKAIIQTFTKYKRKAIYCKTENWEWRGNLLQMAVANGKFFGNGICVCPDAVVDDGIFHIALFGELSIKDYLKNLKNLKKGIKITHKDAHYHTAKELRIENLNEGVCDIETDGEYIGSSPATISVVPKAINFLH